MLILWVFALTGTSIALLTRKVTDWLQLEISSVLYWCTKVMMLLIGYPVLLLIVALPFGMLSFFLDVEKKILQWLGLIKKTNTKSNAE